MSQEDFPTFDEAQKQLQIEVFGAERMAQDEGNEASLESTLELKRAVLQVMNDEHTIGNDKIARRTLERRWQPPVEIWLTAGPEELGLEQRETDHWLAHAPLRIKHLVFENVHAPQRKLARIVGIDAPLLYTASESLYFDDDNKAWVTRSLVYPHKTMRDALRDKEREAEQAIKPASQADIDRAFDLLTKAVHEDDTSREVATH
jgi:hypothetical protein